MGRVELCSNSQMLDCFFETATFLKDLTAEAIAAKEPRQILGDHLAKLLNVHKRLLHFTSCTIP